jgi:prepilin-type N-terminal cleavage/methylation domain-containing protein
VIKHHRRRDGFTLIEIMVVLGIIGILVGLSIGAIMRIQTAQQIRSSSDVVEKVQVAVDNQYKAIIAQAAKDLSNGQPNVPDAQAILTFCSGDTDRALALLTYCRIRQSFPQVFAEVQPFTIAGFTYQVKSQFLPFQGATAPANVQSYYQQSAILLYAAVAQTGAGGSVFTSDATNAAINPSFQFGSLTGPVPVYMDSWKQPVGFCRFGTNLELQGAPYTNTKTGLLDPLDPSGKLQNWTNTTNLQAATVVFLNNGDVGNATSFNGSNRRPVVYSTGYNVLYEMLNNNGPPPSIVIPPGKAANDDILGYRLTQLGQRGTQ